MRPEKVFDIEFLETLPTLVDGELALKLCKKIPADHRQQGTTHRLMSGIELLCVKMTINLREGEPDFAG
jgi:hypothetical protein